MTARIRIVVAELTMQDGRTTGRVATSLTEGGRTTIRERRIDSGPVARLSRRQLAALRAAPIGVEIDHGNRDPENMPRYRYQGVDGRIVRALWLDRKLLTLRSSNPHGPSDGGVLVRTPAGGDALAAAGAA